MRSRKLHARRSLLIGLGVSLVLQAAVGLYVLYGPPWLWSPNYGHRLTALRARMETPSGRATTVVMFGSSLTVNGLRPTLLDEPLSDAAGQPVHVYNFGFWKAGPFRHLLHLRRLLEDGVRPDHVLVEFMPVLLNGDVPVADLDEKITPLESLRWQELSLARHAAAGQRPVRRTDWGLEWAHPVYTYRLSLLTRFAPSLLRWEHRQNDFKVDDPGGWIPMAPRLFMAKGRGAAREKLHQELCGPMQTMHPGGRPVQCLEEFLELCRREKIPVTVVRMPESPLLQTWWAPEVKCRLDELANALQSRHEVRFIDARNWLKSEDVFIDGFHLDEEGATQFTRRLGEDFLLPTFRKQQTARGPSEKLP